MNGQTPSQYGLIDQLESALGGTTLARRADILRKVTDLFLLRSGAFSEDQIALFDTVMGKLLDTIESSARAQFGSRIARLPDAPRGVVRLLPLIMPSRSQAPCSPTANGWTTTRWSIPRKPGARTISWRFRDARILVEAVTDVLVERGNRAVVAATAHNNGARFSDFGVSTLVRKAATTAISRCASGRGRTFRGKTWSSCSSMRRRR